MINRYARNYEANFLFLFFLLGMISNSYSQEEFKDKFKVVPPKEIEN
jgi:hypothetical protein